MKEYSERPMMKLEKILGVTTLSNSSISSAARTSDVYYAAGSVVVCYNAVENIQKTFYKASKAVSCLTVSPDGRYLAVGERGHSPNILIWEISSNQLISTINGTHKHGIGCLAFSSDGRYLVSAGFKHDRQLVIWDWENLSAVTVQKLGNKVNALCFHPNGNYFVTCGDRHLKWWYLTYDGKGPGSLEVSGKPASILESHKNAIFMDIKIGLGDSVFCTTSTGLLCAFNETRFMDMWVQLESTVSYSLSLHSFATTATETLDVVIVGCTEGLIRVFSAKSLQYLATMPLPVPTVGYTEKYPACLAICTVDSGTPGRLSKSPKLAAIYSDCSLFIWGISDIHNAIQYRSFAYHRACIWDVQFITSSTPTDALFPPGTFVTCSADNSIRIWNGDPKSKRIKAGTTSRQQHGEMLHLIEVAPVGVSDSTDRNGGNERNNNNNNNSMINSSSVSSSMATTIADIALDALSSLSNLGSGIPDLELPDRPQIAMSPRALAVHPSGRQLVCGDRSGMLRVFDLGNMTQIHSTQAHSAEVLTLHYSPPARQLSDGSWTVDFLDSADPSEPLGGENDGNKGDRIADKKEGWKQGNKEDKKEEKEAPLVLLASAGRDRLVHVFKASNNYSPVTTLDNHSSSVTVVKFTPDGKRLLSCGGDRTMVFNNVTGTDISRLKSVQTPHGTINGLAIEATNKFAITSGQDRRLNIWNLQTGKHMRAYKNDAVTGELYKTDVDPSGMFVAACAFDKTVNLFDFFSGDLVAQVCGHSELVTSVRFSPDGRYLLSVGGDGCVMMWSLASPLVGAMQERLLELVSSAQKRQRRMSGLGVGGMSGSGMGENDDIRAESLRIHQSIPPIPSTPSTSMPPVPPTYEQSQQSQQPHRLDPQSHSSPILSNTPDNTENIREARRSIADSVGASIASNRSSAGRSTGHSRWASRVEQQGGYELFGRKMNSMSADKHKLTLELTNFDDLNTSNDDRDERGGDDKDRGKDTKKSENNNNNTNNNVDNNVDNDIITDNSNDNNLDESYALEDEDSFDKGEERFTGNKLGNTLEASDDVACEGNNDDNHNDGNDDNDDTNSTNDNEDDNNDNEYNGNDFEVDSDPYESGGERYLANASSKIDNLERSAINLESWLENMIRNGSSAEDEKKGDKGVGRESIARGGDESALLSDSLSSLFFKNLNLASKAPTAAAADARVKGGLGASKSEIQDTYNADESLPVPPVKDTVKNSDSSSQRKVASPGTLDPDSRQRNLDPDSTMASITSTISTNASVVMEIKRKETAAAVAQMKDKLRSMGMLGRTGELDRKIDFRDRKKGVLIDKEGVQEVEEGEEVEEEEVEGVEEGEEDEDYEDDNDDDNEGDEDERGEGGEGGDRGKDLSKTDGTTVNNQVSSAQPKHTTPLPSSPSTHPKVIKIDEEENKGNDGNTGNNINKGNMGTNGNNGDNSSVGNKEGLFRDVSIVYDDEDNYSEEFSEEYGTLQETIQFQNNSVINPKPHFNTSEGNIKEISKRRGSGDSEVVDGGGMSFEEELESREASSALLSQIQPSLPSSSSSSSSSSVPLISQINPNPNPNPRNVIEATSEKTVDDEAGEGEEGEEEGEEEERKREVFLHGLYLEQEAKLRLKAAQCKQIISELTKAKQAALSSFDELAELRTNLNETMASSSSKRKGSGGSGGNGGYQDTYASKEGYKGTYRDGYRDSLKDSYADGGREKERMGEGMNDRLENTQASAFVSGLYPHPHRGETLDSTTDILQGSVVIEEADKLLTEFRESFFLPQASMGVSILSQSVFENRLKPIHKRNNEQFESGNSSRSPQSSRSPRIRQNTQDRQEESVDDLEMFAFLEKYSDRLVEMVSNKVMEKTRGNSRENSKENMDMLADK